jgi:cytochrome P450
MVSGNGEKLNLSLGEVLSEWSVLVNAGSDTTAASLTGTMFLLFKHPFVLSKLRKELDPGVRIIAGKFLQGGTVFVPTYTLLHDAEAFDYATEFMSDRWISGNR